MPPTKQLNLYSAMRLVRRGLRDPVKGWIAHRLARRGNAGSDRSGSLVEGDRTTESSGETSLPNVLILDFDFFTAVGGGQTFYRRVVERNPNFVFHYPSRGPDLAIA